MNPRIPLSELTAAHLKEHWFVEVVRDDRAERVWESRRLAPFVAPDAEARTVTIVLVKHDDVEAVRRRIVELEDPAWGDRRIVRS